jgi:hypothetical protein
MSVKILLFLIILVFLVAAFGYSVYNSNTYSKEVLRLEIIAPEEAMVGEEIEYTVKIKNNSDIKLEEPQLTFEYPRGSIVPEGQSLRVVKSKEEFGGFIYPGQEKPFTFKVRIFGKGGDIKEAKAMISYRPRNLKTGYVSKTSHLLTVKEVPLTFEFDIPSNVGPGQELNYSLNYFSSVSYPLTDIEIKMTYPSGFSLKEADPKGISDNQWRIPLLNTAQGGRIDIRGNLSGSTGETKIFRADFGIWQGGEFIVLKNITKQVKLAEPSLYISQTVNNSIDYAADPGDLLHYNITFRNIGTSPLQNLFLAIRLNGVLFDFDSIRSTNGQYQAGDNSVIWDKRNNSKLQFLDIGEEGEVEFWVNVRDQGIGVARPKLENEIILDSTRKKFTIKVNTLLALEQNVYVDDEIFGSEADFPLKIGRKSEFTVIWRAKNYYNSSQDVKLSSVLPENVKLTGKVMPQKLSFDPNTREIVWAIGEMDPGQGIEQPHQLAFQIEFEPSNNQKDTYARLLGPSSLVGTDIWTEKQLTATSSAVTTQIFGEQGIIE